jgi:hypothetical protein
MTAENSTQGGRPVASGGMTNNMPPQNPHKQRAENSFWCGCDWLKLNFQVNFLEWEKVHKVLDLFAATAIEQKKEVETNDLGGAIMLPGGGYIGKGSGKRGKFCKYRMRLPFGLVVIAESEKYAGTWPNVQINIPGEICLTYHGGADEAYADAIRWLEQLSVRIDKELVSRVDFCADFPGWSMDEFVTSYLRQKWRCRAKRKASDESNGVSLYFGSNPLMLRIYDKLAEMEASALRGEPVKFEHMIQKRWGGVRPESAIRVEYQVSREKLKTWGIDTFADLKAKGGATLGYLTGARDEQLFDQDTKKMMVKRWFRFLLRRRDEKHPERDRVSPSWRIVQETFVEKFGNPEPLIEVEPDNADVEALVKQAFGVLEAAAWNKGYLVPGREITNETKYRFDTYENFEAWILAMLRSVALEKPGYKWRDKQKARDSIDDELEEMEERRKNGKHE